MSTVRSAIDELRRGSMTDYEIEAEIMLAREMIQQGNTPLATKILGETAVLSATAMIRRSASMLHWQPLGSEAASIVSTKQGGRCNRHSRGPSQWVACAVNSKRDWN